MAADRENRPRRSRHSGHGKNGGHGKDSGRGGRSTRRRSARDPHWDNVRLLSGTLVVVGHLIEPLSEVDGLRWLHITSWAMRVPVFVIVAGYFSSAGPLSHGELRRLTESVLVPYLLIGLVHSGQMAYFYDEWKFLTGEPPWGLWFLLSLFCWRLLLPYLAVLRFPLLMSTGAALAVGYFSAFGSLFSASRTVAFLPFFLLGQQLRQGRGPAFLHARWSWHAALAVVSVAAVAGWVFRHSVDNAWLAMRAPYAESVPFAPPWAWGLRGAVLVCGAAVALAFIRLVPKQRIPVASALGAGGLFIYLLHPLVLRVLTLRFDLRSVGPWPEQLGLVAVGVAVAVALASPPVRALTRPLVQPRLPWLFTRPPAAPDTAQSTAPHAPDAGGDAEPGAEPDAERGAGPDARQGPTAVTSGPDSAGSQGRPRISRGSW